MARSWRPLLEVPVILAVALACAYIANRAAGPTRRLSWFPRPAPAPSHAVIPDGAAQPAAPLAPSGVGPTPALPAPASAGPDRSGPARPATTAPAMTAPVLPDPAQLVRDRFPPLRDRAEADIDGEEARWLHAHGAAFLDARRTDAHAAGHVPGALSLSVWEDGLDEKLAALDARTADREAPVVIYCAGGGCEDSHLLAQKLWMLGFKNLRIHAGGFPEWASRGWPIAKGGAP